MKHFKAIAAMSENRVIGNGNKIPWHLPEDFKWFKKATTGHVIVMGRKTFLSIGNALPGRTNIVVTRDPNFRADGVVVAANLDAALDAARGDARRRGVNEIMVIGGTEIFAQTMALADRLEITHVHSRPAGDAYFPPIDLTLWREAARSEHPAGVQDDVSVSFATYVRA